MAGDGLHISEHNPTLADAFLGEADNRLANPRLAELIGLAATLAQPGADGLLSCSVLREVREG